jgi:long-subunit fatty acid transport protein
MKKILIISALIIAAAGTVLSQNSSDALRYSRIDIGGTARFMGLSGAFGALGADFTASSTNPAGLGLFKASEFTSTAAIHTGSVKSDFNGISGSDSRTNFYLGNIGLVMTSKIKSNPNKPGWRYVSFATGLNRLNDFNYRYEMVGNNQDNSLLDTYVNAADGINFHDIEDDPYGEFAFDLNPAWWNWMLDLAPGDPDSASYISPVTENTGKLQSKQIDSYGSMNEYVFSFGANYNERLYLGLTFGIPMIRYFESAVYSEYNIESSNLMYFDKIEELETHGTGFNIKAGFIYRVNDWFRFGGAFHSPSWFGNMTDYWRVTHISEYYVSPDPGSDQTYYVSNSPSGTYDYNLNTPYRVQGNLAFIIGNIGLISADYEFADYSKAQFDGYDYSFASENAAIENSYSGTHHIRIGTEWRYSIYSFRAGGKYFTTPYQDEINDGSRLGFSGGIGLKKDWFFMDIAYAYRKMNDDYYFYNISGISSGPVANKTVDHYVLMTLGVKL